MFKNEKKTKETNTNIHDQYNFICISDLIRIEINLFFNQNSEILMCN